MNCTGAGVWRPKSAAGIKKIHYFQPDSVNPVKNSKFNFNDKQDFMKKDRFPFPFTERKTENASGFCYQKPASQSDTGFENRDSGIARPLVAGLLPGSYGQDEVDKIIVQ